MEGCRSGYRGVGVVILLAASRCGGVKGDQTRFEQWAESVGRVYATEEEKDRRYEHWLRAYEHVERHNRGRSSSPSNLASHYWLRLNEFSDATPEEVERRKGRAHGGERIKPWHAEGVEAPVGSLRQAAVGDRLGVLKAAYRPIIYKGDTGDPPDYVDWRYADGNSRNVSGVTPIKNQYHCGACWSFSVAAAVEGTVAADNGILNEVSSQQMIDCDANNRGCDGGDPQFALQYVMGNPLASNVDYPFVDYDGAPPPPPQPPSSSSSVHDAPMCKMTDKPPASKIQNYLQVDPCNERALMWAVSKAPVVAAIDAYCMDFQAYGGGVLTSSCASPDQTCTRQLDHAITIVGYGTDPYSGLDYWLIKNSWGTTWGEEGFGRIKRGPMVSSSTTTTHTHTRRGGGGGDGLGGVCGIGCITSYAFFGVGGVAYVNGTPMANDDFPHGEAPQALLEAIQPYLYAALLILGAVCFSLSVVAGGRKLYHCMRARNESGDDVVMDYARLSMEDDGGGDGRVRGAAVGGGGDGRGGMGTTGNDPWYGGSGGGGGGSSGRTQPQKTKRYGELESLHTPLLDLHDRDQQPQGQGTGRGRG